MYKLSSIRSFILLGAIICLGAVGCIAYQHGYSTARYTNLMLPTSSEYGADRLRLERGYDSTVDTIINAVGTPSYILVNSRTELKIFYIQLDRAYAFKRSFLPEGQVSVIQGIPDEYITQFLPIDQNLLKNLRSSAKSQVGISQVDTTTPNRFALIIGNSNYQKGAALRNPANDAQSIATALKSLHFQVIIKEDATKREMDDSIRNFSEKLNGDDIGLFYFAGHGMQVEGENYLVPVDSYPSNIADVQYMTVPMNWILKTMEAAKNGVNIIIFDACRTNPFPQSQRSASRGLALVSEVHGSLIAFSTSPGKVAEDGSGHNSPYAKALIEYVQTPGVSIEQMFKQVRISVMNDTHGYQTPWELSSLVNDFYFAGR